METVNSEDIKKISEGEIVEIPSFGGEGTSKVKLRRPSLITLCKTGVIPNELVATAQKIYEGEKHGDIVKYGEILHLVAKAALVEPKYEDVKDLLTDEQLTAIFNYTQMGVRGLLPFRFVRDKFEKLQKGSNSSKRK